MLTLYDYLPSQNAWKVRQLLHHLEQPYHRHLISIFEGEGKQDDYLEINPTGAVPAIVLEDGRAIAESNAILVYLASDTLYLPSCAITQAQVMQWLCFESDYVQSSVATLRHWILTGKDVNRPAEQLVSMRNASIRVLSVLDRRLAANPFLVGERYTIADISVFAYVHLVDDAGIALADFQNVFRWVEAVSEQPRFLDTVYPYSIDEYSVREL